jgi:hypothetical protein
MSAEPNEHSVQVHEPQPKDLLQVIAQAVADPRMDVAKMEKLLDMHERIVKDQRKTAYKAAMARLAPKLPQIDRHGHVVHETKSGPPVDRRYSKYEDIDEAIRPLYSAEGFSLSWDTAEGPGGKIRVIGTCSHAEGHDESRQLDLPHDSSGSKNPVQAVASTISYGKRLITEMIFNLVSKGQDVDGESIATITEEQVLNLQGLITEVKADKTRFLLYMKATNLEGILARDYVRAVAELNRKRKRNAPL